MKYKIILLLFLTSCTNNMYNGKNSFTYSAKGFALIDSQSINSNNNFLVSHNKLKSGTKIRVSNPNNNASIEATIKKKIIYDNFYKVLISKDIAEKLELDLNFPYVEITEVKTNKSFIAKKAITENVEKKIVNSIFQELNCTSKTPIFWALIISSKNINLKYNHIY